MNEAPDLSILIPLYNEEACLIPNLRRLIFFLRDCGLDGEIILGSNGSTDATIFIGNMLSEIDPARIRFFHMEERGVVGAVFKRASAMASSPALISMDMDLSVELEFIPKALALLERRDLVIGSKQSGSQHRSTWRRMGSAAFILCAQKLLGLPYDDYSLGAKAYRLDRVKPWTARLSDDTNYVLELIFECRRAGLSIAVLPVLCDDWRSSRFRLLKEALVRFTHLFRLCLKQLKTGRI